MNDAGWYVARTQTNRERWAAENIQRQGAEFYLPKFAKPIKKGRVTVYRAEFLFPSYIFARSSEGRWRFLLGTFGISQVVQFGEFPTPVPAKEIARLRAREDDEGLIRLPEEIISRFRPGQSLRVRQGHMTGHVGLCEKLSADDRVRVLFAAMGRKVPMLIPEVDLEPA